MRCPILLKEKTLCCLPILHLRFAFRDFPLDGSAQAVRIELVSIRKRRMSPAGPVVRHRTRQDFRSGKEGLFVLASKSRDRAGANPKVDLPFGWIRAKRNSFTIKNPDGIEPGRSPPQRIA